MFGFLVTASGRVLKYKFEQLGIIQGKTLAEITAVVGLPNSISAISEGKILRQWQATGYHIALLFDSNDICEGITHVSRQI